ncbi:MAG: flagellar hook-associated protein FlgL [Planctomycetota bacterium]
MPLRPTQSAAFGMISRTLSLRLAELLDAQQMTSTGKRILKPSDDPVGASMAISLRGEQASIGTWRRTASAGRSFLEATNSALVSAQGLFSEIRALSVQGLSGTMTGGDRLVVADQLEALKASLLDVANTTFDDRYLFAGSASSATPFTMAANGRVSYLGNGEIESVLLGEDVEVSINEPGSSAFLAQDPRGLSLSGVTGLQVGSSPNQGRGWVTIDVRHDATTGTLGSGVVLANGGADDTILGDRGLVIDSVARTVKLGNGRTVNFPQPGDADIANYVVRDEHGAVVHLDFSGYDGTDSTSTLTGTGSIRAGNGAFVALDPSQTDLELVDPTSGAVLHVDATGVVRASQDLARFSGTVDSFDAIDGIIADLRNESLSLDEVQARMEGRMAELIRNQDAVLAALGRAGASLTRLQSTDSRLSDRQLAVTQRLSGVEDVDATEAILAMTRAQQSLELAHMAAARLMQTSLLDYLR